MSHIAVYSIRDLETLKISNVCSCCSKPKTAGGSVAGDFAEVAYFVLRNRCPAVGSLTLEEVDQHLSNIAASHDSKEHGTINPCTMTVTMLQSSLLNKH